MELQHVSKDNGFFDYDGVEYYLDLQHASVK